MAAPTNNKNFHDCMFEAVYTGVNITLLQVLPVTTCNRISVVSCHDNLSMYAAIKQIYSGAVDQARQPSVFHFLRGITGHLLKEMSRVTFKAAGIVSKPSIDKYYKDRPLGAIKSDLVFAGSLSAAEMGINPFDTVRTMWQAGERVRDIPKGRIFSHLYKGAGANGIRQFGIWLGFPFSERIWSQVIDDSSSLDSHSLMGIVTKSLPQSFQITAPIWVFERLKNELQYHPDLLENATKNRYALSFEHIRSSQGWKGFIRGFFPKVLSNYILIIGANYLLELGRSASK